MTNTNHLKKHGGHNAGKPSPKSQGHGPCYEIRMAQLNPVTGKPGMTQSQFAEKVGCSEKTIKNAEANGSLPHSRAVQANILELAPVSSTPTVKGEPEPGGVII